eukprot:CAMPEP_0117534824 /NCGR_PEP_ID=MMETSP0784-20121206/40612_1 /TAXON_ID=39447 /ORGANISM="" /LENGTH=654 /DNA_ID=CAMNT_0005331319 /DNA_START=44 /DNA_END=2005 /DNA_ORIENTATION=+
MASLKDFGYEDVKVIGRGQYGKAHLVTSGKEQTAFIAKTIDLTCLSNKERETALQEVELLRRLDHPNIVEYKDNFFLGDTLVIVMQYCEGGDIATYIKELARRKTRLREVVIMNYFVQVLQALQYIHHERILHRDLKTSNLFLMKSKSVVKLGDFGISRVLEGSTLAAITVVGTPYYMSPEVCENRPYTFKSDVWALGCVLYELCMLKHAFSADNLLGLVYKIVSDHYEPIPQMYSQALNALIQRMLEKKAEKRPSVRDLLADVYVQSFMNEYVRTRGQCATPAAGKAPASRANAGSGGAQRGSGDATRSRARGGGGGDAGGGPHGGGQPGATNSMAAGGERPTRPARPARPTGPTGGGRGGGPIGSAASTGGGAGRGGVGRHETPKEAAARRKREAADREAEKFKAAAKQSVHNKTVARRMKEAEFKSTRAPFNERSAESAASTATGRGSGSVTPDEEHEHTLEEISEAESSGEEYEDDFEDSDEEVDEYSDVEDANAHGDMHVQVGGALSTVREEQDFTRVMSNYEQDLARAGASPPPRRPMEHAPVAAAAHAPAAGPPAHATSTGPAPSSGSAPAAAMDIHSRARRVREDLIVKMGENTFNIAFDFLLAARARHQDERSVRRELEKLVGRDVYKNFCFEVDQLVFQQMLYS